jgi:hypothetical protein
MAKEIEAGLRPRQPVTEVMERYGIESVARRVDDLYERVDFARRGTARGRAWPRPVTFRGVSVAARPGDAS